MISMFCAMSKKEGRPQLTRCSGAFNTLSMLNARQSSYGHPLPDPTRMKLRALVDVLGQYAAAERLGVGAPTIARALAGLGIRRATKTAIEARLATVDAANAA